MTQDIRRVAVLGAGTMGHGIAQVSAQAGWETTIYDIESSLVGAGLKRIASNLEGAVSRGKLDAAGALTVRARLRGSTDLAEACAAADLVIEAVPERLELKRSIFETLDRICAPETLLATNTSSLSVTMIAESTRRPERVLGLHFFNPVHIMELLEIVRAERSSDATIEGALRIARALGKTPIVVRDSPGFASSRLGLALGLEAIRMVEEGVALPQDIDTAMTLGYKHPLGPLRLTDLVGLDVRLHIAEYLARELSDARFQPPALLRALVADGKLGKKSGQGFYVWPKD